MANLPNPVVVVPGITATYLKDEYVLPPEMVWTVMTNTFERTTLHPDDLRYESAEPARIVPDQVFEVAYKELIGELRHNLTARDDRPVPVYPFGYDWRMPLSQIQARLADFVAEVIDRTKLLRHYDADRYADDPKVNLLGHSMGGLIIAGYLRDLGAKARVGKVATLASPFRGSFEAVIKVITGTANLGGAAPSSREREAARLTPALYHLLPAFPGAIEVDDPHLPTSFFDPAAWQPSVIQTISEYIRLHGLKPTGRDQQAQAIFEAMLEQAKSHRAGIESLTLSDAGLSADDWLCVVGADCTTRVLMRVTTSRGQPQFDLRSTDRANLWSKGGTPEERRLTGDGTVPLNGAIPAFLRPENLVCVTPDDYGYWEVQDKLTSSVAGFHGIMPNMNMLHRLLTRFFLEQKDKRRNTWGRPLPGIESENWAPPLALDLP